LRLSGGVNRITLWLFGPFVSRYVAVVIKALGTLGLVRIGPRQLAVESGDRERPPLKR
jgi:hypothetical protein